MSKHNFTPGSRVSCKAGDMMVSNKKGTVISVDGDNIGVSFDGFTHGHSLNGKVSNLLIMATKKQKPTNPLEKFLPPRVAIRCKNYQEAKKITDWIEELGGINYLGEWKDERDTMEEAGAENPIPDFLFDLIEVENGANEWCPEEDAKRMKYTVIDASQIIGGAVSGLEYSPVKESYSIY